MSRLTVFTIIRNGIQNGYPFVESFGSWLRHADRVFVLDGESTDGTDLVLHRMAAADPRFTWASAPWPDTSRGGSAIADFTNVCLEHVRGDGGRLIYIQADEVYRPHQREMLRAWPDGEAVEFRGCVNFWNSFDRVLANDFPMRYIRLFPNTADISSIDDGFSFDLTGVPVRPVDEWILHYGWCFPVNVLQKHVSHARLYPDQADYRARGAMASEMLRKGRFSPRLLDALELRYRAVPFRDGHPACMRHVIASPTYDPYVGLAMLESGQTRDW